MSRLRYNKSKTYLLPLLSELVDFDTKYFSFLKNTYIADDLGKYEDCFYVLHDFSFKNPEFTRYEHKITKSNLFVDLVDIGNQVLYVFKFPEDYKHEYDMFKEGKYSQFKADAKEIILSFYTSLFSGNINAVNFLLKTKQILFKDRKLKEKLERDLKVKLEPEAELASKMEISDETFELSKYIKEEKTQ